MNTKNVLRRLFHTGMVLVIAGLTTFGSCDKPEQSVLKPYQGVFRDQKGVQLDLVKDGAQIQVGGKTYTGKAVPLSYAVLASEKPAYYSKVKEHDPQSLEVFWLLPDATTKRSEGGLITYRTDVFYMVVDLSAKTPVQALTVTHSADGEVMLDTENQDVRTNWQIGWLPNPDTYSLTRVNGPDGKPVQSKVKIQDVGPK